MKAFTARIYCAETYDKTKKSNIYLTCFGTEEELGKQRQNIRALYKKRNEFYRNGLDLTDIDSKIQEFKDDVENRKKKSLQQQDNLPLIKTKKSPDLLIDDIDEAGSTVLICGSSKRGKTHLLKKIWERYYKDNKNVITILISPSCNIPLYEDMKKNVIKINRYDKQTDALLKKVFKIQNLTKNAYRFCFLIDDCVSSRYSETLDALFLYARNLLISSICCIQRETLISRSSRSSANNVVTFGINTEQCIKGLLESFYKCELTSMGGGHSFLVYIPFKRELKHYLLDI
jgi:Cdc6-like AAA superfamily ATPase